MREQVCIYMCPWPRIQAAMMDEDTITVAYREWRGEPRGKHRKAHAQTEATTRTATALGQTDAPAALGDCIDCMACVNVCPMGIDIRDGQQLECITCALCIDACDDIMDKIGKPRGLIDYMALTDETRERARRAAEPGLAAHLPRRARCSTPCCGRRSGSGWWWRCSSARTSTMTVPRCATRST